MLPQPPGPGAPNMATTAVMIDGGGLLSRGSVHMPTARGPSAGSSTPQQHLEELCLLGLVSSGSGDTDSPAAVITGMGGGGSGLRHSASLPFAAPRTMLRPHRGYPSVGGAGGRGGTVAAAAASTGPEGPAVLRPRASVSAGHMMVMGIETAHIGGTQEGEGGQQRSSSVSQQARLGSGAVDARSHGRSVSTEPVTTGQPSAKRIRTADGHFAVTAVNAVDGGCGEAAVAAAAVNGVAAVAQVPPGTSNIRAARIMEAALWRSGGGAGPDATQEHAESFLGLQHQLLVPGCVAGAIGDAAAAAALGAVSRQLGIRVVDVDTRLMPAVLGLVRAAGLLGGRPPPILLQAANCRDTLLPPPPPPGTLRTLFQTADGRILPGHVMPVNALVDGDVEIEDVTTGQELNPRTRGSLGADASGVNVDWMREYEDAWDEVLDAAARRRGSAPAPAQPQRLPTKSESDGSGPAVAVTAVAGTVLASGGTHATGPAESEHLMLDGDAAGEPMRPEASFRQPKHQQQQQQQHPWLQQLQLQIHSATGRQLPCQELAVPSHIGRGTEGTAAAAGEQPPDALALMASVRQQSPRELEVKPHGGRGQLYQSPQEQQQRAPEHQQQHGYRPNMQKCSDIDALREEIQQHLEEGLTKQELRRQLQRRQGLIQHQQQHHHHHHLSQKVTVPSAGVKEQNIEPKKESLGPVICSTDSLEAGRGGDVSRQWDATAGPCVTSERYTSAGREVVGVEPMLGAVAPLGAGGATRGPVGRHRVNPDEDYSMQISDDDSGRRLGGDGDGGSRGIAASGGDGSHGRGLILCSQDSRGRRSQPPLPRPPVQPFRQARRISDDTNRAGNDTAVATAAATDAATHGDVANAISGHEDECTTAGRRRDVPTLLLSLPRADSGDRYAQQPAAAAAGGWDKGRQPSAGWAFSEHQLQPLQQSRAEMATGHSNVALPGNTAAPTHEADNKPRWTSRREQQRQQQQERQQQQQQDAMASVLSAVIPAATLPRAQVLLGRDGSLVIVDPSDGVVLAETPAAAAAEALSDLAPALRVHEHLRQYGRQQPSQQRSRATEMRTESSDGNQFRSMDRAAASGGGGRSSGSGGGGYGSHGNISRPLRSPPRGGGARTSGTLLGDAAPPSPPPPAAGLADASSTGNLEPILVQNHQHLNRRRLVYENSRGLHVMESSFGGSGAARGGGDCAARDSDPYHAFAQRPPLPPRSQAELHFGCVGTETQQQASAVRPSLSLQLTPLSSHQSVLLQQQGRQMREAQQHHQHLRLGRVHLQQPAGVESDGGHGQPMPRPRTAEGEVEAAALALSQLGAVAGRPRSAPSGVISGPVQETVDDDVVEVSG
ncbi:hypothetical protein Vretimale_2171 [Volvox reticuliferus]|uniref:Uncharacterized protein n=1 Tax=Volvox reticuliferus TaxID=1737510 RepID=A0A8J4C5J7_9CHLO|nr:hypothetical protein Vretifemale_4427 [Volvox reticuliferus]GIL96311.1 hypothetical protein Vretimale_2171 [Volvox reticuliferus]